MSQGPLPTAARRYPYNPSLIPPPLRDARPGVGGTPGHYPAWFLRSLNLVALDGHLQAAPHDREELFRLEGQIRAGRVEITGATMRSGGFPSISDSVTATKPTLDDIDRTVREMVEKHNSGEKPVVTIDGKRPVLRHLGGTRVVIDGPDGKDNAVLVITSTGAQAVFS